MPGNEAVSRKPVAKTDEKKPDPNEWSEGSQVWGEETKPLSVEELQRTFRYNTSNDAVAVRKSSELPSDGVARDATGYVTKPSEYGEDEKVVKLPQDENGNIAPTKPEMRQVDLSTSSQYTQSGHQDGHGIREASVPDEVKVFRIITKQEMSGMPTTVESVAAEFAEAGGDVQKLDSILTLLSTTDDPASPAKITRLENVLILNKLSTGFKITSVLKNTIEKTISENTNFNPEASAMLADLIAANIETAGNDLWKEDEREGYNKATAHASAMANIEIIRDTADTAAHLFKAIGPSRAIIEVEKLFRRIEDDVLEKKMSPEQALNHSRGMFGLFNEANEAVIRARMLVSVSPETPDALKDLLQGELDTRAVLIRVPAEAANINPDSLTELKRETEAFIAFLSQMEAHKKEIYPMAATKGQPLLHGLVEEMLTLVGSETAGIFKDANLNFKDKVIKATEAEKAMTASAAKLKDSLLRTAYLEEAAVSVITDNLNDNLTEKLKKEFTDILQIKLAQITDKGNAQKLMNGEIKLESVEEQNSYLETFSKAVLQIAGSKRELAPLLESRNEKLRNLGEALFKESTNVQKDKLMSFSEVQAAVKSEVGRTAQYKFISQMVVDFVNLEEKVLTQIKLIFPQKENENWKPEGNVGGLHEMGAVLRTSGGLKEVTDNIRTELFNAVSMKEIQLLSPEMLITGGDSFVSDRLEYLNAMHVLLVNMVSLRPALDDLFFRHSQSSTRTVGLGVLAYLDRQLLFELADEGGLNRLAATVRHINSHGLLSRTNDLYYRLVETMRVEEVKARLMSISFLAFMVSTLRDSTIDAAKVSELSEKAAELLTSSIGKPGGEHTAEFMTIIAEDGMMVRNNIKDITAVAKDLVAKAGTKEEKDGVIRIIKNNVKRLRGHDEKIKYVAGYLMAHKDSTEKPTELLIPLERVVFLYYVYTNPGVLKSIELRRKQREDEERKAKEGKEVPQPAKKLGFWGKKRIKKVKREE